MAQTACNQQSEVSSVIFLIDQPLDSRNKDRFALEFWDSRCDYTLIIDLTRLNSAVVYEEFLSRGGTIDASDLCVASPKGIFSLLQLLFGLRSPGERGYFVVLCDPLSLSGFVSRYILTLKGYVPVTIYSGLLPARSLMTLPVDSWLNLLSRFSEAVTGRLRYFYGYQSTFRKIRNFIKVTLMTFVDSMFLIQQRFLQRDEVIVETGLKSPLLPCHADARVLRIAACSFDYDSYLRCEKESKPPCQAQPYFLFLDEDMFNHIDYLRTGRRSVVSASRYLPSFHYFVREVTNLFGCQMVVASHPRSMYTRSQEDFFFPGLLCVAGNTVNLVKHASAVICHSSTSVNFAVLYRKKIIFLTSSELEAHSQGILVRAMSSALGLVPLDIDSFNRDLLETRFKAPVNEELYLEYERSYIRHPSSPDSRPSYESIYRGLLCRVNTVGQ